MGSTDGPRCELASCGELGLLTAPLPFAEGGVGLGSEPGTHAAATHLLAALGSGDLALGRIYEGHLNALLLLRAYGTAEQMVRLAEECRNGALFAVWNTGSADLLKLEPTGNGVYRFEGVKTFATAADFVQRPIVTAELPGGGWQMCCPRLPLLPVAIQREFWHPLGMESSESFGIDFTGATVAEADLIGAPGDFYRDPLFRGGAIRFSAVQAGAAFRLHSLFAEWLRSTQRGEDPWQLARLADVAMLSRGMRLWLDWAAATAEDCFLQADAALSDRMVDCANMTRLAIESACTEIMQHVTVGVGARGLLQPHRFERILRDLTMYLRQPAPDQTRASVGRAALLGIGHADPAGKGGSGSNDEREGRVG